MPETEPNLCLTDKSRVGIVELRNHTQQVNQTQGRGCKTRSMVQHLAGTWHSIRLEAPNAKLDGVEEQKHRRGYEAKNCDSPSQATARRYRGSMDLVADPDAHNTGTGSPLPGSRSTPETTVPLLFYPVWLFISNLLILATYFYTHTSFFILRISFFHIHTFVP